MSNNLTHRLFEGSISIFLVMQHREVYQCTFSFAKIQRQSVSWNIPKIPEYNHDWERRSPSALGIMEASNLNLGLAVDLLRNMWVMTYDMMQSNDTAVSAQRSPLHIHCQRQSVATFYCTLHVCIDKPITASVALWLFLIEVIRCRRRLPKI